MLTEGQDILEGRFQIVKKVGSGAFGEIYKGKRYCFSQVYPKPLFLADSIQFLVGSVGWGARWTRAKEG